MLTICAIHWSLVAIEHGEKVFRSQVMRGESEKPRNLKKAYYLTIMKH